MPRPLEDMIARKSSIRQIKIEKIQPKMVERETPIIRAPRQRDPIINTASKTPRGPRYRLWIVAIVAIAFFLIALSYLFSKAFISITPKSQAVTLNERLSAVKDASNDNLGYDLVVISGDETKSVSAGAEKDVAVKATGTVIIYNNFSAASQKLDIDTRLEGSNGKMYKTNKAIVVPGMVAGKPGSVEVGIYAAEAGAEYNSAPLDFKIFGFKGTPKYAKFYGRGKTPLAGGLKGKMPSVLDTDIAAATTELKSTLQAKLLKKAGDQIPSGFILFKDAVFLNTTPATIDYSLAKDGKVPMTLKGTLYGFIFDEVRLTKHIAKDEVEKYDNSPVYLPNLKDIVFTLTNKDTISFADVKNIDFTLTGNTKIVWKIDETKFTTDVLGQSKSDFKLTLAKYPSIDKAELRIRPFWRSNIPGEAKDVDITVLYPAK